MQVHSMCMCTCTWGIPNRSYYTPGWKLLRDPLGGRVTGHMLDLKNVSESLDTEIFVTVEMVTLFIGEYALEENA